MFGQNSLDWRITLFYAVVLKKSSVISNHKWTVGFDYFFAYNTATSWPVDAELKNVVPKNYQGLRNKKGEEDPVQQGVCQISNK